MSQQFVFCLAVCCLAVHYAGVASDGVSALWNNGIIDGIPVKQMNQFPHEVSIKITDPRAEMSYCSASIVNESWILTSVRCVDNAVNYELSFNRTNLNATHSGSFSVNVGGSSVYRHPSEPIALIRLPVRLQFSEYIKPVALLTNANLNLTDRLSVMAGLRNGTMQMSYGQFEIISAKACAKVYNWHNEKTQICTQGFRNNDNVPCWNNIGGGLLINWPGNPVLVGVFNSPGSCLSRIPAEYVRITTFIDWINSVIRSH